MDSVEQVLKAFQTGQIGAAQFNTQMKALGYDLRQVVSLMNDINNPRVTEITIPNPANPPAQAAAPAATTAAPTAMPTAAPAATPMPMPAAAGNMVREATERSENPYYGVRQPDVPGEAQRFRPAPAPAVQQAIDVAKQRTVPQQTASAETPQMDALHALIRGRFGDAARGNPMDDRLTAAQEARDKSGEARASGGEVNAKGGGKDAVLHKALEIIHHLVTTR